MLGSILTTPIPVASSHAPQDGHECGGQMRSDALFGSTIRLRFSEKALRLPMLSKVLISRLM